MGVRRKPQDLCDEYSQKLELAIFPEHVRVLSIFEGEGFRSLYCPLKTMDRLVPLTSVRGQPGNSQKILSDICV